MTALRRNLHRTITLEHHKDGHRITVPVAKLYDADLKRRGYRMAVPDDPMPEVLARYGIKPSQP